MHYLKTHLASHQIKIVKFSNPTPNSNQSLKSNQYKSQTLTSLLITTMHLKTNKNINQKQKIKNKNQTFIKQNNHQTAEGDNETTNQTNRTF